MEDDHVIPSKSEHRDHDVHALPRELWNPEFHGMEDEALYNHHYGHADGIDDEYLENVPVKRPNLKLKEPAKDDPRLNIPTGKTAAAHDHLIVPKEPVEEEGPSYGQAYEHDRKQAIRGQSESAGLAPKHPTKERRTQMPHHSAPIIERRHACSAYGATNRCEGMSCEVDEDCSSQCCGQMTKDGSLQCHSLIEGNFCPRALAPLVDYSLYSDEEHDSRRNALNIPINPRSNEMPSYRGQDGCKVHGTDD